MTKLSCLVHIDGVNWTGNKTRQFCLVSTWFPICNCSVSNILRITEYLEIDNWFRDKIKLSCLVCSCVYSTDTDKTRQFCLVRVGGVNMLLITVNSQYMVASGWESVPQPLNCKLSIITLLPVPYWALLILQYWYCSQYYRRYFLSIGASIVDTFRLQ